MLRDTTIALARAWNTWSERPLEMIFLPLGVRLTLVGYSDHLRRATLFPSGPGVSFGVHALDGSLVEAELAHGGTRLAWSWRKPDPFEVRGSWRTLVHGEWGLRFWITLCLSADGGETVNLVDGAAVVRIGTRFVALACAQEPVQVTGHDSVEAAVANYEANGYFDLGARALQAPTLALRFNLEMMRDGCIAAAVADDKRLAVVRAKALARSVPPQIELAAQTGAHHGALDAIRDVVGWNSVYDPVNGRPYTCISRNWSQAKFGGFGVWLNDQFYHALLSGLLDPLLARENVATALASATPQGNLACLITARDAWVDRTQIPIGAFVVRMLTDRLSDRSLAAFAYETLARNNRWWRQQRDPLGLGLFSFGTSDVGEALYKGTSFGARNESAMDNSPIHDEADYDPATRTLTTLDVGLNSLLAFDAECLAALAEMLGRPSEAAEFLANAIALKRLIQTELWDESRQIFANRLRDGRFVRSLGPTSFFPLICGAATTEQAGQLLRHLDDPKTFAGPYPLPGVTRDDPSFEDNTYWRGRIWPPLNFLVWHGLRRYGLDARASRLAEESVALFRQSWEPLRLCPENYNANTGEALDQPDTESFYGWGALMPMMGVAEIMDVNPWGGWEVVNEDEPVVLGPIESPAGTVTVERNAGWLKILRGGSALLETTIPGRIRHLQIDPSFVSMSLPESWHEGCRIILTGFSDRRSATALLGDQQLPIDPDGCIRLPASETPPNRRLRILLTD